MSDTLVSPGATPAPPVAPNGGGINSWSSRKKIAVFGGGTVALGLIVFLWARSRSSSSSSSNTSGTTSDSTTPTLVTPSSDQDAEDSSDYASLAEGLQGLSTQVSTLTATSTPTPTTTTTTTKAPTPASPPSPGPAPNVNPSLLAKIPGQRVVSEQYDPAFKDWIVLTNDGGIFNLLSNGQNGPGYFGNPLGDPGTDNWDVNGKFIRQAASLSVNPTNGAYTITDTAGENYNYGPK